MNKPSYLKPILIGGLVSGLLSGIPCTAIFNCACCACVIAGAMMASYLYVQSCTNYYPTDGDGAIVGLGSGAFGGLIAGVLSGIMNIFTGPANMRQFEEAMQQMQDMPPEMRELMEQFMQLFQPSSPFAILIGIISNVVIFSAVGALGGFIGLRIFLPRRFGPQPPGAVPPGYGGYPPPGTYGPGMPGQPGGYYNPPAGPGMPGQYPPQGAPPQGPQSPYQGPQAPYQAPQTPPGQAQPPSQGPGGGGKPGDDDPDSSGGSGPPSWGGQ